jgi:hypothetical protein
VFDNRETDAHHEVNPIPLFGHVYSRVRNMRRGWQEIRTML